MERDWGLRVPWWKAAEWYVNFEDYQILPFSGAWEDQPTLVHDTIKFMQQREAYLRQQKKTPGKPEKPKSFEDMFPEGN